MVNKALAKKKNPVGRPRFEITPEVLKEVEACMEMGLTVGETAHNLGITRTTFYEKQAEFPEFFDTVQAGRARGIKKMTSVIFKKGFVDEDFNSAKYWLNNKAGWSDKKEIAQTVEHKEVIDLSGMTVDELETLRKVFTRSQPGASGGGAIQQVLEGVYEGKLAND